MNRDLCKQLVAFFAGLGLVLAPACVVVSDDDSGGDADAGDDDDDDDDNATSGDDDDDDDDDDGMADSSGDGGELSMACTDLCGHTETASQIQADCVPIVLSEEGGYLFTEASCVALAQAYENGIATNEMCVQCYLDAAVEAEHCVTAETTCF